MATAGSDPVASRSIGGIAANKAQVEARAAEVRRQRDSGQMDPYLAYDRLTTMGQATEADKPSQAAGDGGQAGGQDAVMQSTPQAQAVDRAAPVADTRAEAGVRTALGAAGPSWKPAGAAKRAVLGQEEAKAILDSLVTTVKMNEWRADLQAPTMKFAAATPVPGGATVGFPPKLGRAPLNLNMIVSTPGEGPNELEQYGAITLLQDFVSELHKHHEIAKDKLIVVDAFDLALETAEGNKKPAEIIAKLLQDAKGGALLLQRAHAAPKLLLVMLNEELKKDPRAFTVFFGGPRAKVQETMKSIPGSNLDALVYRDLPITALSAKDVATRMREIAASQQLFAKPATWSQAAYLFVNKAQAPSVGIDDAMVRFISDGYERLCGRVAANSAFAAKHAASSRLAQLQAARLMRLTLDDLLGSARPNIEAIKKLSAENANTPELQAYFQKLYDGASLIDRVNRTKKEGEPLAQLNKLFTAGVLLAGPKGTGKSTAVDAIALGNYHARLTVDPKPVIKVPADLKKGYLGQSGQAALALLQEVMGKTLFVDEFHNLITSPQDSYGLEVSAVLMWGREFYRDRFAMAAAGYPGPLARLFGFEQGWSSRFPFRVNIPSWPPEKARDVFKTKVDEQNLGIEVPQETIDAFYEEAKEMAKQPWWGSGRDTRTIADEAVIAMSQRIAGSGDKSATLRLEPADVRYAVEQLRSGRSMDELDDGDGPDVTGAGKAPKPMSEAEVAQITEQVSDLKDQIERNFGPMLRAALDAELARRGMPGGQVKESHEA